MSDLNLQFYRACQLAAMLNVHRVTIWKWAASGKMPAPIKITSGVTAWRRTDIDAWLATKERRAS